MTRFKRKTVDGGRLFLAVQLTVIALPGPQGSKRYVGTGKSGRGILVESSRKVKPWREAVVYAARGVMTGEVRAQKNDGGWATWASTPPWPLDGPLWVSLVLTLPKPKSAPKNRRTWPMRTPDLSKLARSTEDALTDAGVWADDARLVEYLRLAKVYPGEDPDALDVPGARIAIYTLGS